MDPEKTLCYNVENIESFFLKSFSKLSYNNVPAIKSKEDAEDEEFKVQFRYDSRLLLKDDDDEAPPAVPTWPAELDDVIANWFVSMRNSKYGALHQTTIRRKRLVQHKLSTFGVNANAKGKIDENLDSILQSKQEFKELFQSVFEQGPEPENYAWISKKHMATVTLLATMSNTTSTTTTKSTTSIIRTTATKSKSVTLRQKKRRIITTRRLAETAIYGGALLIGIFALYKQYKIVTNLPFLLP